jgi:hypothetical protein
MGRGEERHCGGEEVTMRKIVFSAGLLVLCGSCITAAFASIFDDICFPLKVGYSWTYYRERKELRGEGWKVRVDTLQISVINNMFINNVEYVVLNDGNIFRTLTEGKIWWYNPNTNKDILFCDLGDINDDYYNVKMYDGIFRF